LGTVAYRTLERFLRFHCRETLKIKGVTGRSPYFLVVNVGKANLESLYFEIKSLGDRRLEGETLLAEDEAPKFQKYDEFIPAELLRKAFTSDYLDIPGLSREVSGW
jgi:ATP-dependent Lhr-like helicase